ncbi:MAG: hypothetical protein EXR09_04815 [Acetobacteraceae bacterium]|nr:hypothetical protein [Acetobacteraceae bacterium]
MSSAAETPAEAAQRLEHALERISLAIASAMAAKDEPEPSQPDNGETAAVRARLDALLVKLRAGLAERPRG